MVIRSSIEEEITVAGDGSIWLEKCASALAEAGFTKVQTNATLFQLQVDYRTMTISGGLQVTLTITSPHTKVALTVTANVDNIFALFRSPGKLILGAFKAKLR